MNAPPLTNTRYNCRSSVAKTISKADKLSWMLTCWCVSLYSSCCGLQSKRAACKLPPASFDIGLPHQYHSVHRRWVLRLGDESSQPRPLEEQQHSPSDVTLVVRFQENTFEKQRKEKLISRRDLRILLRWQRHIN